MYCIQSVRASRSNVHEKSKQRGEHGQILKSVKREGCVCTGSQEEDVFKWEICVCICVCEGELQ